MAPSAHLADGRVTLVLVSDCSRAQYLRFLLLLAHKGVYEGMLPFVEVVQATAVQVGQVLGWRIRCRGCRAVTARLFSMLHGTWYQNVDVSC